MSEEFFENLSLVSTLLIVVPFAVACIRWKKLSMAQRKLASLVVLIAVVELFADILWRQYINNHPVYHVYSIFEFLIILMIYASFFGNARVNKFFYFLGSVFTLFAIANMLFFQDVFTFNSNVTITSSVLIILLSLSSFYKMLIAPTYVALHTIPVFWMSSGFLLYFSSNLILFYLGSRVELSYEESLPIWGMHSVFNCILILFYTTALWTQPQRD